MTTLIGGSSPRSLEEQDLRHRRREWERSIRKTAVYHAAHRLHGAEGEVDWMRANGCASAVIVGAEARVRAARADYRAQVLLSVRYALLAVGLDRDPR